MNSLSFAQILLSISAGLLGGGVIQLIGVWGVEKLQNRRLAELELDVEQVRMSQKSFQKTVSGRIGAEVQADKRSVEKQAQEYLTAQKSNSGNSDQDWLQSGKES